MKLLGVLVITSVAVACSGLQSTAESDRSPESSRGHCMFSVSVSYDDRQTDMRVLVNQGQRAELVWSGEESRFLEIGAGALRPDSTVCEVAVVSDRGAVLAGPFVVERDSDVVQRRFSIEERNFELEIVLEPTPDAGAGVN